MNPAINPTSERIYAAVKQRVLEGAFRPGERIEAARLAETLNSSLTPVRAALQRLAGEHLVEARPSEGFHRPPITEVSLRDLYEWNGRIAVVAAQLAWPAPSGQAHDERTFATQSSATTSAALFSALARRTGSAACVLALDGLNDQLHAARRIETHVLGELEAELADLVHLFNEADGAGFRQALAAYHRRRVRATPQLVDLLHRPAP